MILTIPEREFANYLKQRGLTYKEIAYLKWKNFDFDGEKITVPRRTLGIPHNKVINLKENNQILHIAKMLEGKRRHLRVFYYVFYEQFPLSRCKKDDLRRYGSPFTPEKMEEMIRGYSVETEAKPLLQLKLTEV